jgi:lantibiotic modifying enzyme
LSASTRLEARNANIAVIGSLMVIFELLEVAGSILKAPLLRKEAQNHAFRLCQQAEHLGSFRLLGQNENGQTFFSPTFFQGMAGIGYELLRLSAPDALPSVLLLA